MWLPPQYGIRPNARNRVSEPPKEGEPMAQNIPDLSTNHLKVGTNVSGPNARVEIRQDGQLGEILIKDEFGGDTQRITYHTWKSMSNAIYNVPKLIEGLQKQIDEQREQIKQLRDFIDRHFDIKNMEVLEVRERLRPLKGLKQPDGGGIYIEDNNGTGKLILRNYGGDSTITTSKDGEKTFGVLRLNFADGQGKPKGIAKGKIEPPD
jgi:hypothetical protein